MTDDQFMRAAIEAAKVNLGKTAPNPVVGCVLVRDGVILGSGVTAPGGRPHAEDQALRAAGEARGATAYVTLEPCGARSSGGTPCSQLLVEAGVVRVVIACDDPSPFAAGLGSERLRAAGINLQCGVLARDASLELNYDDWIANHSGQIG